MPSCQAWATLGFISGAFICHLLKSRRQKSKSEAAKRESALDKERSEKIIRFVDQLVSENKIPCALLRVNCKGQTLFHSVGYADKENKAEIQRRDLFRIYSMTKAVTSVAAMMLWEEGKFHLNQPISDFLPEFSEMKVLVDGVSVPANKQITFLHLLTHTSGLTYHFLQDDDVAKMYREANIDFLSLSNQDLGSTVKRLAQLPLVGQPGEMWNYGVSTDVLGHLVEVISGKSLEAFFRERIFRELGMHDTFFQIPPDQVCRLAKCYLFTGEGSEFMQLDPPHQGLTAVPCASDADCQDKHCAFSHSDHRARPALLQSKLDRGERIPTVWEQPISQRCCSGGGGLISTIDDYSKFTQFLLRKGVSSAGKRLLGRKTVEFMTRNHLPGSADLAQVANLGIFSETSFRGVGFGLGFALAISPTKHGWTPFSPGSYFWGGMASTAFMCDPSEELSVVFMTQLVPSSAMPDLRRSLYNFVYSALV